MSEKHDDFDFSSLSLKDLIEARDLYHFHLMSKANVVGTAIGLYLIRNKEDWPQERGDGISPPNRPTYPREFSNSQVRDYSWPCIIVLVREWVDEADFGKQGKPPPWQIVPTRLYLPDGRTVPVCTVLAPPVAQGSGPGVEPVAWPKVTFGGGLPVYVSVQKETHQATLGCLVSDGHTTYALTARHACGEKGTKVSAMLREGIFPIGSSSKQQITRKLFSEVYPALPLRQTWLNLDVGLVRLDDIGNWTPNVYGLPPIKPLFDIYEQNLSLRKLMDKPVIAMGAASGLLQGRIKAMFYRYRSVGGFDYVSDFLIAPEQGAQGTHHGDSGALWHLQMPDRDGKEDTRPLPQRDLRPLAIEWGAQVFAESAQRSTYSVATSLSNICKLLDVELVVEGGDGVSGTWGAVGHYSIGTLAIDLVQDATLKQFLQANADSLSLPLDALKKEPKVKDLLKTGLVALADVPDMVWKKKPPPNPGPKGVEFGVVGGRDTSGNGSRTSGPEHPNHHCDADAPFEGFPTLLDACIARPDLLTGAAWNRYYDGFSQPPGPIHRGILPFRIWQYFERMKEFASTSPSKFIAAAGTLAHYVGDASQPLHGSVMHDGDESVTVDRPSPSRKDKQTREPLNAFKGEGVHSAFETAMINHAANKGLLFPEIRKNLPATHGLALVGTGKDAAIATMSMMRDVARTLPPARLADIYEGIASGDDTRHTSDLLWNEVKSETAKVMALGVRTLAMIWDAAWKAGRGAVNPGRIEPDELRGHYEDASFMRSVMIDEIEDEIADPARAGGPAGNRSRARDSGESGDDGSGEQAASVRSAAVQVRTRVKRSAPKKKGKAVAKRRTRRNRT